MIEPQNVDVKSNTAKKKVLAFLITAIIATVIAIGCYFGVDFLVSRIDAASVKTEETYATTKQLQVKYDQLQDSLQNIQQELQKSNVAKTKYWKPIVIEHLVHMAGLTLNTTRDTKLAISFLVEAQQYADDPELSAINHALNKDIADLQVVPTFDAVESILKIEAISQKVGSLPVVMTELVHQGKPVVKEETSQIRTLWHRFFKSAMDALKDMVIVRHKAVDLLLSPEQEAVLRLEIQAKLLQAELAVMQRKNKIYQSCLEGVYNLLTHYFNANQNVAADVLPLLQELQRVDLEPSTPFPSESIAAITNFVNANKVFNEKLKPAEPSPATPGQALPNEGTPS